jgi:hypothetical protein
MGLPTTGSGSISRARKEHERDRQWTENCGHETPEHWIRSPPLGDVVTNNDAQYVNGNQSEQLHGEIPTNRLTELNGSVPSVSAGVMRPRWLDKEQTIARLSRCGYTSEFLSTGSGECVAEAEMQSLWT